jgi:general secretion pathway protein K
VVVIWAIGILALLFSTYVGLARYRAIEAAGLAKRARAEALADAGINIGILDLLAGRANAQAGGPRFGRNGRPAFCTAGPGTQLAVAVTDEGGKVDLNTASPELVEALLLGIDRGNGARTARNILALREAVLAAQRAQGLVSAAAPVLRSVLEFDQFGETESRLLPALLPLVTVHSRSTGIDPGVAPLSVLNVLSPGGAASREEARRAIPSAFAVASPGRTFLISVESLVAGTRSSRDVVVEVAGDPDPNFKIHEYRDGSLRFEQQQTGLAPC